MGSTSPARGFTVTNSGTANLTVGTIEITGSDAGQFAIQNNQASGRTLTPGQSASLEVVFTPASQGAKSASLRIPSNDPANSQLEVSLAGTGVLTDEQAVAADKAALTFEVNITGCEYFSCVSPVSHYKHLLLQVLCVTLMLNICSASGWFFKC